MIDLKKQDAYPGVSRIIIESLNLYVNHRISPGGFLTAVLENDLTQALGRADSWNKMYIHDIVSYIYNYLPSNCWGSPEKVQSWLSLKENEYENIQKH